MFRANSTSGKFHAQQLLLYLLRSFEYNPEVVFDFFNRRQRRVRESKMVLDFLAFLAGKLLVSLPNIDHSLSPSLQLIASL